MTMRWLTRSVGVSLPLLLLFAALQAHAPRSPGPDVAEAAPAVGKPVSAGTLPATISSPRGSQRATEGRPALVALRSHPPVLGPISSDFGAPRSFWLNRPHTGIDIIARRGTPVRAPAGGTVTYAGWHGGYGKTIIIDHGGELRTLYGHLSHVQVSRGQHVAPGATIALTGATGHASGPHLHYEILVRGRPVNPRGPDATAAGPGSAPRGSLKAQHGKSGEAKPTAWWSAPVEALRRLLP